MTLRLLTVGHGTLDAAAFLALLHHAGVARIVDVRRYPGSRRHPHFARPALQARLEAEDIAYRWAEDLGGRRATRPDSPHRGLREPSFRGYADHMEQPPFGQALAGVLDAAMRQTTAVLCAETLWWRCHRRLIADAVVVLHDAEVVHLHHDGALRPHVVTDAARLETGVAVHRIVYDRGQTTPLSDTP